MTTAKWLQKLHRVKKNNNKLHEVQLNKHLFVQLLKVCITPFNNISLTPYCNMHTECLQPEQHIYLQTCQENYMLGSAWFPACKMYVVYSTNAVQMQFTNQMSVRPFQNPYVCNQFVHLSPNLKSIITLMHARKRDIYGRWKQSHYILPL